MKTKITREIADNSEILLSNRISSEIDSDSEETVASSLAVKEAVEDAIDRSSPAGTVIAFAGNKSPFGYLLCDGTPVSRTTYKRLFDVIGTLYGVGDGSTTFNLPNLTDKFIQGSATSGTVKAAGLPNIEGYISARLGVFSPSVATGAFYKGTSGNNYGNYSSGNGNGELGFDASLSNAIYGTSNTVQPPALTMRYYIKY